MNLAEAGVAPALDVEDGLSEIAPLFAENFRKLSAALCAMKMDGGAPGVKSICAAQGGYFLVAETHGIPDVDFCRQLAEEKGVVCTPMSVFYASEDVWTEEQPCCLVRFTVCKSKEHIDRACKQLRTKSALIRRNQKEEDKCWF